MDLKHKQAAQQKSFLMHYILIIPIFHSQKSLEELCKPLKDNFDRILLFDNTPISSPRKREVRFITNDIIYIKNGENIGVAAAFNYCIKNFCINDDDVYMLLDQDTAVENLHVVKDYLEKSANLVFNDNIVGFMGRKFSWMARKAQDVSGEEVAWVLNTGMLFSRNVWELIGGFDESFFVDDVDHEFCLRAKNFGIGVYRVENTGFRHEIGHPKTYHFGNLKFRSSRHPHWRKYYWARNRTILLARHRNLFALSLFYSVFRSLFISMLFEEEKIASITATAKGLVASIVAKKRKRYSVMNP